MLITDPGTRWALHLLAGQARFEGALLPPLAQGDTAVLDLDIGGSLMRVRVGDENVPREGDTVAISVRPQDIHLFDPESRKRLS